MQQLFSILADAALVGSLACAVALYFNGRRRQNDVLTRRRTYQATL